MATVASGEVCGSYSGGAGGYIDYTFTDAGKFTAVFTNSAFKTWDPYYSTYFGIIVEYNGTQETLLVTGTVSSSGYTKSVTFTFDRSCTELTIYLAGWDGNKFVPSGLVDTRFEDYPSGTSGYTVTWSVNNTPPTVSFNTLPTLYAGKAASISFTGSDAEGDYHIYYYLTRYYKAPGSSSYSSTYVDSTAKKSSGSASITDNIPSNYVGYSVYYKLEAIDDLGASKTITSSTVTVQKANTAPTVTFDTLPVLNAGLESVIRWTTSDADGDTVNTTKLIRYHKASGASSYTATTLISSSTSVKYYRDTIPEDIIGGSVYYTVTVSDGTTTKSATSTTVTVQYNNPPTITFNTPMPTSVALGDSVTLSWEFNDAEGDKITFEYLLICYSKDGDMTYDYYFPTISQSTRSYTETVTEEDNIGCELIYVIGIVDDKGNATQLLSPRILVKKPCNVKVIKDGVITEASGVATIQSGVITDMDGELHTVISGVIT